jgi:hypothetical protein
MRQGLDIVDVEVATKIRAKYLRALENEEFAILPGSTFAKTFLRTYAEYLGLDAQLLIEEYRAQHEPRGEGEAPAFGPRAGRVRERRGGGGPPIGPGTAFAIGIVLLLVLFAVIGLAGGDDDEGDGDRAGTTTEERDERPARKQRKSRRASTPRTLRVRVVPQGPTYVCVDDGEGDVRYEGTLTAPRTFRNRGRLRINLGRAAVRLTANGKRVRIADGPAGAGFSIARSGKATPLPPAQRPCA